MPFFRQRKLVLIQGYGQNPQTAYSLAHDHKGDQKETIAASARLKNQFKVDFSTDSGTRNSRGLCEIL